LKPQINTSNIKQDIKLIYDTFEGLKKLNREAKQELSEIDKELSNHYHTIEGVDIRYMSDSHLLITKLRDILFRRREAKINHTMLESFVTSMQPQIDKTRKRNIEIIEKHNEILQEIKNRAK
jgi:CRISPR/Cas system CSM-associated protein Csm2 small subunit